MNPHDQYVYPGQAYSTYPLPSNNLSQPPGVYPISSAPHYNPVYTGITSGYLPPEMYPPPTYVSHLKAIANHILASDARIRARRGRKSYADQWSQAMITQPVVRAVADTLKRLGGIYCREAQETPQTTTFPSTYPNSYKQDHLLGQDQSIQQDHFFGQAHSFNHYRPLLPQDGSHQQHTSAPVDNDEEHINVVDVDEDQSTSMALSEVLSPLSANFWRVQYANSLTPPLSDTETETGNDRDPGLALNSAKLGPINDKSRQTNGLIHKSLDLTVKRPNPKENSSGLGAPVSITQVSELQNSKAQPRSEPLTDAVEERPNRSRSESMQIRDEILNLAKRSRELRTENEILNNAKEPRMQRDNPVHANSTVQFTSSLDSERKQMATLSQNPAHIEPQVKVTPGATKSSARQVGFDWEAPKPSCDVDTTALTPRDKLSASSVTPCAPFERNLPYTRMSSTEATRLPLHASDMPSYTRMPSTEPTNASGTPQSTESSNEWSHLRHQFVPKVEPSSEHFKVATPPSTSSYESAWPWTGHQPVTVTHTHATATEAFQPELAPKGAALGNTVPQTTSGASLALTWQPGHQQTNTGCAPRDKGSFEKSTTPPYSRAALASFDVLHARTANEATGLSTSGDLFSTKSPQIPNLPPTSSAVASEIPHKNNTLKRKPEPSQPGVPTMQTKTSSMPRLKIPNLSQLTAAPTDYVTIGDRGTQVQRDFYDLILWDDCLRSTKMLMQSIFDIRSMVNLTVDGPKRLNPNMVHDIATHVALKCGTSKQQVLDTMRYICSVAKQCYLESKCT